MRSQLARLASVLTPLLFSALVGSGCAGWAGLGRRAEEPTPPDWVRAVFPQGEPAEVRVDRYENRTVIVRDGHVVGSNAAEDLPAQVVGVAAALALVPEGPTLRRVGVIGFGTGVAVGVALNAGSRVVDVFEQDGHLVGAGESLASVSRLSYDRETHRPVHPALRLVPPELAARERFLRYDVLVSPPATSSIVGVDRLIGVERLEDLRALLNSDGILVHHVPAVGMEPETLRRILRTFAHVFAHVMVLSAHRGSSDLFVVGSPGPLTFRVATLRRLTSLTAIDEALRAAGVDRPFDLPSLVLFGTRQEVLNFVQTAPPIRAGAALAAGAVERRPPVPRPDAPDAERRAWMEAERAFWARHRRTDLLLTEMYGLEWPYGQVCPEGAQRACLLEGLGADDEAGAETLAELSLSLMAAGRFVEAQLTIETAAGMHRGGGVSRAEHVLVLLLDDPPDLAARLPDALSGVRAALDDDRCADAEQAARAVDATNASFEARTVAAYALVRCLPEDPDAMAIASSLIEPVASDQAFVGRYPEVLYLAAHAAMVLGAYDAATETMLDYLARSPGGPSADPRAQRIEPTPTPLREPPPDPGSNATLDTVPDEEN